MIKDSVKVSLIPFSGVGGVTEKRCSPICPVHKWQSPYFRNAKPPIWFGSNSKTGGVQWEHLLKVLWKFHSIPLGGVGGVADMR